MKKLLLILLCLPLLFSCGEKDTKTTETTEKGYGCMNGDCENGYGTYTNAYGSKYVGEYKDDKMHGEGTYTYADGSKYVGEYKDGKRHGQGTYTTADGEVYEGLWENEEFIGE